MFFEPTELHKTIKSPKTNLPSIPLKIFGPIGVHKMIRTPKTQKNTAFSLCHKHLEPTEVHIEP